MRGHGTVDVRHAFEQLIDRMARELELDPFAVRRANLLEAPTRTPNDLMVNSYGLSECLQKVETASKWNQRRGKLGFGRGLGMAASHYVSGAAKPVHWTGEPHAVVSLKLDFDGGITALTGASDIGQGSTTMIAVAAAEVLGVDLARIQVVANDSVVTPKDNGFLFFTRNLHGRQCGHRGGKKSARHPGQHRCRQARRRPAGYRMRR